MPANERRENSVTQINRYCSNLIRADTYSGFISYLSKASLKPAADQHERIYVKTTGGVAAARADIARYFNWCDTGMPRSSLKRVTPEQTCLDLLPKLTEAA